MLGFMVKNCITTCPVTKLKDQSLSAFISFRSGKLLLSLTSAASLSSKSHRTRDHILLSQDKGIKWMKERKEIE
jgi:hypothetical protein